MYQFKCSKISEGNTDLSQIVVVHLHLFRLDRQKIIFSYGSIFILSHLLNDSLKFLHMSYQLFTVTYSGMSRIVFYGMKMTHPEQRDTDSQSLKEHS